MSALPRGSTVRRDAGLYGYERALRRVGLDGVRQVPGAQHRRQAINFHNFHVHQGDTTVGVALRGHPFSKHGLFIGTGGHGGPPLQLCFTDNVQHRTGATGIAAQQGAHSRGQLRERPCKEVVARRTGRVGAVDRPGGGLAAPEVRAVDQVVVDERRHVHELDGDARRQRRLAPGRQWSSASL